MLLYAWWASGLRAFSAVATWAIGGGGIVAMAIGHVARRPGPGRPPPGPRAVVSWAALIAAMAAWQVLAYAQHPRSEHPTLSSLVNSLLDTHLARAVALVAWLLAGTALARR
ncbi:MAG: hypothetical protein ACRDGJ_01725 [Candidatus Limnocylindria bacterium]